MLGNSARSSLVCLSFELGFGFGLSFELNFDFDLDFGFNFVVWCLHHSMLKCGIAHAPKVAKDMRMR